MLLAAAVRLPGLRSNPGWYTDEGSFLNVATNLANGKWQYFALGDSLLLLGRPPLFVYLLRVLIALAGPDILVLRGLAATCGIASVGLLYGVSRSMFGARHAFFAGAMLAILPGAVSYGRIGFTYNLLAPLALAALFALWRFAESRRQIWLWSGAVLAGVSLATDYQGLVVLCLALVTAAVRRPRSLPTVAVLGLLPLGVCLAPLVFRVPAATWHDLTYTYSRAGGGFPLQFAWFFVRLGNLVQQDGWFALGMVGLLLLPSGAGRTLTLAAVVLSLAGLLRAIDPVGQGSYHLIPLYPLLSIGLGAVVQRGIAASFAWFNEDVLGGLRMWPRWIRAVASLISSLGTAVLVVAPFAWMLIVDVVGLRSEMVTSLQFGRSSPWAVEGMVRALNPQLQPDDMVLASPQVAWMIPAHVIDIQQVVACEGERAHALPEIERARFLYPCDVGSLHFVVQDDLIRSWAAQVMPEAARIVDLTSQWPLVFHVGEFSVYRNPAAPSP